MESHRGFVKQSIEGVTFDYVMFFLNHSLCNVQLTNIYLKKYIIITIESSNSFKFGKELHLTV